MENFVGYILGGSVKIIYHSLKKHKSKHFNLNRRIIYSKWLSEICISSHPEKITLSMGYSVSNLFSLNVYILSADCWPCHERQTSLSWDLLYCVYLKMRSRRKKLTVNYLLLFPTQLYTRYYFFSPRLLTCHNASEKTEQYETSKLSHCFSWATESLWDKEKQ